MRTKTDQWKKVLVGLALVMTATTAKADPVQLIVQAGDPQVNVGSVGGGRFRALLDGVPVYVYCVDFAHAFQYGQSYWVDVTPLTGDLATETRYGGVPLDGWHYANNQYTALQRYMMASWLITQYAPYLADSSSSANQYQARGIQSAIWALLDPAGVPYPPSAGNRSDWLTWAGNIIQQPDYDDPTDTFYRYFRVVSPVNPTSLRPQEFIVVVTPEPASVFLFGGVLACVGFSAWANRRLRGRRGKRA